MSEKMKVENNPATPTASPDKQVIDVTRVEQINQRTTKTIRIKAGDEVRVFRVWSLSGPEMRALNIGLLDLEERLLAKKPQPVRQASQGQDRYNFDDPTYLDKLELFTRRMKQIKQDWHRAKILEFGFFNCNDIPIVGKTDDERQAYVEQSIGGAGLVLVNAIIDISYITQDDIENL